MILITSWNKSSQKSNSFSRHLVLCKCYDLMFLLTYYWRTWRVFLLNFASFPSSLDIIRKLFGQAVHLCGPEWKKSYLVRKSYCSFECRIFGENTNNFQGVCSAKIRAGKTLKSQVVAETLSNLRNLCGQINKSQDKNSREKDYKKDWNRLHL